MAPGHTDVSLQLVACKRCCDAIPNEYLATARIAVSRDQKEERLVNGIRERPTARWIHAEFAFPWEEKCEYDGAVNDCVDGEDCLREGEGNTHTYGEGLL